MKKRNLVLAAIVAVGLGLLIVALTGNRSVDFNDFADVEALRLELRGQVDKGKLTKLEAQVILAEALGKEKGRARKKSKGNKDSKLERLGAELKESMKKGDITEEEAKAKYSELKKAWSQKKNKTSSDAKQ